MKMDVLIRASTEDDIGLLRGDSESESVGSKVGNGDLDGLVDDVSELSGGLDGSLSGHDLEG